MKIPKTLKICGLDYKVIEEKDIHLKEGLDGEHSTERQEIRIRKNDCHQQRKEKVLFHEILHAIDVHWNNDSLTEEQIDRLANGIYQVLKDNNLLK